MTTYLYLTLPYLTLSMVFCFFFLFLGARNVHVRADMMDTGHCGEFG